ncbi:MAG TPA: hypothetical protein VF380_01285, partial [Solirubrobacteraceae bacterium]
MSATNGSTLLRSRSRIIGCALVAILALSAMFASAASANPKPIKETTLALGDSLAFGYSQELFNANLPLEPASAFEAGYANDYLALHKPAHTGLQLVNNGCPGETTDSLIGNGALAAAFSIPGEAPCAYHATAAEEAGIAGYHFPLHHEYGGSKSQLESALEVLGGEAAAGTPVTSITLNIGANDELRTIGACKAEVQAEYEAEGKSKQYGGGSPEGAVKNCILAHVTPLFEHILTNIGRTLTVIRQWHTKFGGPFDYTGKIVILGGYDPYGNVLGTGELLAESNSLTGALNLEEEKVAAKF